MAYYVSDKAIEELNRDEKTLILDEDGNAVGGYLLIKNGKPLIYNLFGSGEHIYLDRLKLDGDYLRCEITTHNYGQFMSFYMLGGGKTLQTEWEA